MISLGKMRNISQELVLVVFVFFIVSDQKYIVLGQ